jgi:VIT1/CCC1 family predicted Fe2+/Mn2+ transporter
MAHDALRASAATFSVGAALPLVVMLIDPANIVSAAVTATSLAFLAGLGWLAARTGGARSAVGALRVAVLGAVAIAVTYGVGTLFGAFA